MPTFALSGKYTPESLDAVRKTGHGTRQTLATETLEQLGGKVLAWYWLTSPEYDFVTIVDLPSTDEVFAINSFSGATGAFVRTNAVQLRTSEAADAAIARQLDWTPPGA